MFKNLLLYRIEPKWDCSFEQLNQALEAQQFVAPTASEEKAIGWVAPRGIEHAALVESIAGQWIFRLRLESKSVPAAIVAQQVQQQVQEIEQTTGRRPGKKEQRDLKELVHHSLLPRAFTKTSHITAWINKSTNWLLIDASSHARADELITLLTKALTGFSVQLVQTNLEPATAMASWLLEYEIGAGWQIGESCELKASNDEQRSSIKYSRHSLDLDEIRQHIKQGKPPNKLELNWQDKISLVLNDALVLSKIKFSDSLYDSYADGTPEERFDTDAAIATAELEELITDLLVILDGEVVQ